MEKLCGYFGANRKSCGNHTPLEPEKRALSALLIDAFGWFRELEINFSRWCWISHPGWLALNVSEFPGIQAMSPWSTLVRGSPLHAPIGGGFLDSQRGQLSISDSSIGPAAHEAILNILTVEVH